MAGRNAKPVALHIAEGNPNRLTKEAIKHREESEVKLGASDLKTLKKPKFITQDKIAVKLWNELIKEYQKSAEIGIELLTSTDVGNLALYCKTYSEYERLLVQYQRLDNIVIDEHILDEYIGTAESEQDVNLKALRYLSQLASMEGILKIETAINKKMDMLLKFQDRLFLNPLAKIRNVPMPKKENKKSAMAQFMNRRADGHGT